MPNPMLMSPEMSGVSGSGVSGGGSTNANSQVNQLANSLAMSASGSNSTGPMVSKL